MIYCETVRIDNCVLYRGNCLDILPILNKNYAIITDPPYGINFKKGSGGSNNPKTRPELTVNRPEHRRINGDDKPFNPSMLLEFSHIITWGANHYAQYLPHGRWLVWDKLAGRPAWDSFSDVELAWQSGRGKDVIFSHLWKGICQASEKGQKRQHPMRKPVKLMEWCISRLPASVQVIVDPYMGVGSTGIACMNLNKKFIGIEIDEEYFKIACERLAKSKT